MSFKLPAVLHNTWHSCQLLLLTWLCRAAQPELFGAAVLIFVHA